MLGLTCEVASTFRNLMKTPKKTLYVAGHLKELQSIKADATKQKQVIVKKLVDFDKDVLANHWVWGSPRRSEITTRWTSKNVVLGFAQNAVLVDQDVVLGFGHNAALVDQDVVLGFEQNAVLFSPGRCHDSESVKR